MLCNYCPAEAVVYSDFISFLISQYHSPQATQTGVFLRLSSNGFCYFSKQTLAQKYPIFSSVYIGFIPFLYREPSSSTTKYFVLI